ncbi:2-hydroxyacid dehydrogenase [Halocynthiibacter namhaensis]|uniref:2-hydroxyacid dehydrogenase n=1 Tax=Halocynthiibacter namhaensis TaxID=1290553 RepID=UPI00057948C7|nr:glyoxylate/hydroxypyruvate reductase A [Halocynthiibacter namhaensis]
MSVNILFAAKESDWSEYEAALATALGKAGIDFNLSNSQSADFSAAETDYMVWSPNSVVQDFTPYTRCKAVLSLWAGVERVINNPTLTQPLCRMVDRGLEEGMVDWVTGHTLRHHLGMDAQILGQNGVWAPQTPPLARHRQVTVLGLGPLGSACARMLRQVGFDVAGWSRRLKDIEGITCFSGADGLRDALKRSEILVLLLPNTAQTENIINAETLALMPDASFIINPGRGPLIDDDALLKALDTGKIAHATLDVFRVEPLPGTHPYWTHPNVTVTPHMAAETRIDSSAEVIAENVRRGEQGEAFLYLADRKTGY